MSDDYADSSGERALHSDDMSGPDASGFRIEIRARSQDTADGLWRELEKRLVRKAGVPPQRARSPEANVIVHLLVPDDFADSDAAQSAAAAISGNGAAALNIVLEPAVLPNVQARVTEALAALANRPGFVRLAAHENDNEPTDVLRHQAKAVSRLLLKERDSPSAGAGPDAGRAQKKAEKKARKEEAGTGDRAARSQSRSGAETEKKRQRGARAETASVDTAMEHAERRALKRAEKVARKAEKEAAKDKAASRTGELSAAPPLIEMDRVRKKAEKRTEKEGNKTKRKSEKHKSAKREGRSSEGERLAIAGAQDTRAEKKAARKKRKPEGDDAAGPAAGVEGDRAAKKAAKAAERAARKKRKGDDASGLAAGAEIDRAAKKAAKAARKAERRNDEDSEEGARSLAISLSGLDEESKAGVRRALRQRLPEVALGAESPDEKHDLAVYAFDSEAPGEDEIGQLARSIARDNARLRIFLGRVRSPNGRLEDENRVIATLAGLCDGRLIRLGSKFRRYGDGVMLSDGRVTESGFDLIADSVLGILAVELPKRSLPRPQPAAPPDLVEARELAMTPSVILAQLRWKEAVAPKLLWTHASREAMEALVDEKLTLPSGDILALRAPIAWPEDLADRATESQILGLEFLTGPFAYWYSKAGGISKGEIAEIDALLKERGVKASEILSRAETVMTDFSGAYRAESASDVWQEKAVSRRARVFALYVLCCKVALKRHIRFNTEAFSLVFRDLLDLIELLRGDDFYKPASFDGFQLDCLVVGLGLALRGTAYGDRLLAEGLERFRSLQLGAGLTADGVWRGGSFSDHCSLLATLKTFMGDFETSDGALIEPVASTAKKMTVFAEAMLKSNGHSPALDGSKQKSYAGKLSGTRRALAQVGGKSVKKSQIAAMPRIADTYVFRDAQYFISHSSQKVSEESSLAILHADPPSYLEGDPGGVTLAFAYGETDLIVRGEPPERARKKDKTPLFDPALRNGYHVNGGGFTVGQEIAGNAARIVKSWRGPGWAAARSIDEINTAASISRFVVHLKAVHALIVVDRLKTRNGEEAAFEQVWHVAPGLATRPSLDGVLRFASSDGGMTVAFDAGGTVAVEAQAEASVIRRTAPLASGFMASLFQWTRAPESAAIAIAADQPEGWTASVKGRGFDMRLVLAGEELRCEEAGRG